METEAAKQLVQALNEVIVQCRTEAKDLREKGGYSAAYAYTVTATTLETLLKEYLKNTSR